MFRFKLENLIYSSNTFYNKRNFGINDQDVPFLDFVVLSIIILVLLILGIYGDGMLGEFGNCLGHLGKGRGPRFLIDGEQSVHVFRPRRLCRMSTASGIPSPATFSNRGGAGPGRIITWERAEINGV